MTRFRLAAALAVVAAASAAAAAQPPGGKPLQFKQFGSSPEQFQQSALTRWTGELALDLEAVKGAVAGAKLGPAATRAVSDAAEKALRDTVDLDRQVRRGAGKDRLHAAFAELDRSLGQLVAVVHQHPAAKAATAGPMGRIDAAYHQLAASLGTGDEDAGRRQRRLVRLGDSLDDGIDDLRNLSADQIPNGPRALDRALGTYARTARAFARRARDGADADALRQAFAGMAGRWGEAVAQLGGVPQLPPAVQAQAARVDGLHRRLAQALNLPPYPPGVTPPTFQPEKRLSFAVGADASAQPRVTVYADDRGTVAFNFFAYDVKFDGGVRVDMADLNGDGVPELIAAPGPSRDFGGLPVRVYDGRDMSLLLEFVPFAGWKGGLFAAGAPLAKDRRALVAVTAEGTQHVKLFDLAQGKEVDSFFVHDQKLPGGVRLAWGDVNSDGVPDLLTVNGPSTAPTVVKVFNGKNREVFAEFPVLDAKYAGGGFIAASDAGGGAANPVVGLDAGAVPLVRVFDIKGKPLAEWLAFDEAFRGGVRVAVSARNRVVAGPGFGARNSPVRIFDTGRPKDPPVEIVPFVGFDGGVFVGGK